MRKIFFVAFTRIVLCISFLSINATVIAQVRDIKNRIKQRIIDKKNEKVNTTADNLVDTVFSLAEKKVSHIISGKPDTVQANTGTTQETGEISDNKNVMDAQTLTDPVKLVTEGKFVTSGILFDVNSDDIKIQSYGTLRDIANILKENPDLKVVILGHTDSGEDDQSSMELSKRQAEAVKNFLIKEFSIDPYRIRTDGKGKTQPVEKILTPENKANNNRMEFIRF